MSESKRVRTYRDLEVWQQAIAFVEAVYELTGEFPAAEQFGLTSQLRRAAISIPSNIAEGHGRIHRMDYVRHLSYARGSLMEAETLLILATRLKFLDRDDATKLWQAAQSIGKMLNVLLRSLRMNEDGQVEESITEYGRPEEDEATSPFPEF